MAGAAAPTPFLFSSRMLVTIMCFLAVSMMMSFRLNMSVGIVCMVNQTYINGMKDSEGSGVNSNHSIRNNNSSDLFNVTNQNADRDGQVRDDGSGTSQGGCGSADSDGTNSDSEDGPLTWDKTEQGQVLGAYYYGYLSSQIPAGWTVRKLGGKSLILASSLIASVACLIVPIVALHSFVGVVFLRVLFGILGGLVCPAAQTVISNWAPPPDRSMMGSFTFAGFPCGTLVAFTVAGLMCQYGFAGGWPSVFYVFGIIGVVFSVAWMLLVSESPERHSRISDAERDYIHASLQGSVATHKHTLAVPWKSLLTSLPVYAVVISSIATDFVSNIFVLYMPTYLSEIMHFDMSSNGLFSSLPFIFCLITVNVGGYVSNLIIQRTSLSTGLVRKLCSGSGKVLCIVTLIIVSFLDCHEPQVAVALLVISVGGIGFMTIGVYVNPLDIAPEYSGLIIGIASTLASITGFVSAAVVGAIISEGSTQKSWQTVFLMTAGVVAAGLLFYVIFASGEIQAWAKPPPDVKYHRDSLKDKNEAEFGTELVKQENGKDDFHKAKNI